ncbi:MAG: hypothetical protein ACJ8J0_10925 [Longimicrobiaceae bacterium]
MPFRTILRMGDTGGLDRGRVREAVIGLRDRKRAEAGPPLSRYRLRPGTGVMIARERPIVPYGEAEALPDLDEEREGE